MRIAILGTGTWAFALAHLLGKKPGYRVTMWSRSPETAQKMQQSKEHPKLAGFPLSTSVEVSADLVHVLNSAELIVEAVTSSGVRSVLQKAKQCASLSCPVVITSKGIEQNTGLLLAEVAVEVLGPKSRALVGCLSGPSHAEEVVQQMPTSVVGSAFDYHTMLRICEVFQTPHFRVYPNPDVYGVQFGGAMKNIIGIACGISDGLGYGDNTKAMLLTRGLHEIRKLAVSRGAHPETLGGLAGLGDLCVTCLSTFSRNYRFGRLIAEGCSTETAKARIGMAVEGAYTCVSVAEAAQKIPLPICDTVYKILYEGLKPDQAVLPLMQRPVKEETL